jgi:hypothetical protein
MPAPSPIEQRWTSASTSPLSPASVGTHDVETYDTKNALFSWVGIIMYLSSDDNDPTGYRRSSLQKLLTSNTAKLYEKSAKSMV